MPLYTVIVSSDNPTPQVVIAGQQNGGNGAQNAGVQNGGNGAQNAGVQNGGNGAQNAGVQNAGNGAQNAGVQNGGNGAQAPNHGAQNGGNGAQAQNPEPLTYSTFLPSAVPTASELIDHSTIPEFVGVSGSTLTLTVSANNKITVTGLPHLLEVDVSRYGRPISATNTDWWEFDNPWFWPHRKYWYHKNKRILSIFDVTDQRIRDLVELVEELAETRTPFVETVLGFSHTETLNIAQHAAHANDCFWHEVPQHNFDIGNRSFGVVFVDLVTGRALKQMNRITNGQGYDIWEEGYPVEKGRFLGWTLIARYPVHRKFDSEVLKRRVRILLTEAAALCMAGNSEATPFREDVLQEFVNWAEITEASSISSDVRNNKYVKLATDVVLCGYLCAYCM
ncbi:hypothetical protein B0H13DRAFT_42680 [Mycena leptocephala]|nr:hypothetical protein B0H13DRAFT_42680 [Mycena leptocephala]